MPKQSGPQGLVDLRGHDWSHFDTSSFGPKEVARFRRAIDALADPAVGDATYRLANFAESLTSTSFERFPEASWLMLAYTAAVALDRMPNPS